MMPYVLETSVDKARSQASLVQAPAGTNTYWLKNFSSKGSNLSSQVKQNQELTAFNHEL